MAKKTVKKGPRRAITKIEKGYVHDQMYKVSVEAIASDLELPVARVRKLIEELRAQDAAEPVTEAPEGPGRAAACPEKQQPLVPPVKQSKAMDVFLDPRNNGAIVMTGQQSMQDDADLGASPYSVTPTTEAQRHYIQEKMKELSPEQIAKDVGLLPLHVRQIIDGLNPANVGREKFYERHRNNLHKINPDKPIK